MIVVLSRPQLAVYIPLELNRTQVKALLCFSKTLQRFIEATELAVLHFDSATLTSHNFTL